MQAGRKPRPSPDHTGPALGLSRTHESIHAIWRFCEALRDDTDSAYGMRTTSRQWLRQTPCGDGSGVIGIASSPRHLIPSHCRPSTVIDHRNTQSIEMTPSSIAIARDQLWSTLSSTLKLAGFEPTDFEMSEDVPAELHAIGLPDHLLTLRRRSTGHRQLYAVAPGCPWLFSAFADLTAGRFGTPVTPAVA